MKKLLFKKAQETNSLLLFDEADSLFSRRIGNLSQAAVQVHGINSTKSTLLSLLDKYEGVVVFTTNLLI